MNLNDGSSIKISYNENTKVIHILYEISRKKGIHSCLDFGLFIKIKPNNVK